MISICKAIILVENGSGYSKYISDKDYNDAIAILGIPLKKKSNTVTYFLVGISVATIIYKIIKK